MGGLLEPGDVGLEWRLVHFNFLQVFQELEIFLQFIVDVGLIYLVFANGRDLTIPLEDLSFSDTFEGTLHLLGTLTLADFVVARPQLVLELPLQETLFSAAKTALVPICKLLNHVHFDGMVV